MSQITKRVLSESLKKILERKPLDKVTIKDITDDCGVSRMTFYYHFKDVYDLVEWTCHEEGKNALRDKKSYETWQEGLLQIFQLVLENRPFVENIYRVIGKERAETFINPLIQDLIKHGVEEREGAHPIKPADRDAIANFYVYAFSGFVFEWIKKGMKEKPQTIVNRIALIVRDTMGEAITRFQNEPASR